MTNCDNEDELPAPGISLELAQHRAERISEISYDLQFEIPDDLEKPIAGEVLISFTLNDASDPVILDFNANPEFIHDITVNNREAQYSIVNEHIVIENEQFKNGPNSIQIRFRVGETSLNRNDNFLYTLFVPERASTAFPCFDQPDLKGTYRLTLTIPPNWEALANGKVIRTDSPGDSKTITFDETQKISSYLFAFAAGEFKTIEQTLDGRSITMLHRETDSIKLVNNVDEIFKLHSHAITWLEEYTGTPYPFKKFGFVLIPSFQYGGMEHPGAITYNASRLLLDESATQSQLLGRASLIAHETAHMWFGDLVTMNWFDDVWMKEVFANYMAAKIVNPSFPEINHDLRFLLAHYPGAYDIDRSKGTHPIQQSLDNLKNAGTLYGSIIYQKAPIAMRKLERRMGDEAMKAGLREYLSTFAYGNANWDDLIDILNDKTDDNLISWSNDWIKQGGMPGFFVRLNVEDDTLAGDISLIHYDMARKGKSWKQKLNLKLIVNDSMHSFNVDVTDYYNNIDSSAGIPVPQFIVLNGDGYGYGYFALGRSTEEYWHQHLHEQEDPLLRGIGWLSLWESMLQFDVKPGELLETMILNLEKEKESLLIQRILDYLTTLFWKFLTPDQRQDAAVRIEDLLWNKIHSSDKTRIKSSYFKSYRSIVTSPGGIDRLYRVWTREQPIPGLNLSENDFTEIAYQIALRLPEKSDEILSGQLGQLDNPDRKARMAFINPFLSPDFEVRDGAFEQLKNVKNRHHEAWVQQAIGFLHHPLRNGTSEKYITPTLELLEELQLTGDIFFPKRVLDNTLWGYNTETAENEVRQFLYRHNHYPPDLKNKILQSSDLLFRSVKILITDDTPQVVK